MEQAWDKYVVETTKDARMDDAYEDPAELVDFFKCKEAANAAWGRYVLQTINRRCEVGQ